jgi:hypothetical protein
MSDYQIQMGPISSQKENALFTSCRSIAAYRDDADFHIVLSICIMPVAVCAALNGKTPDS